MGLSRKQQKGVSLPLNKNLFGDSVRKRREREREKDSAVDCRF